MPKLSTIGYAIRMLKQTVSQDIMKIIYYSYFHSLMNYGIIFWGNSSYGNKVFTLKKIAVRILTGSINRNSCRDLFENLNILTLPFQIHFFLLRFCYKL
jgi:hypothetical protein